MRRYFEMDACGRVKGRAVEKIGPRRSGMASFWVELTASNDTHGWNNDPAELLYIIIRDLLFIYAVFFFYTYGGTRSLIILQAVDDPTTTQQPGLK